MRGDAAPRPGRFILYVEGAGDRGILRAWAYRLLPARGPRLLRGAVILGGRQPARALEHLRSEGGPGARGLCVLDRDDAAAADRPRDGLEFFTWSRRHIESYLLVPAALRRALVRDGNASRLDRFLRENLPAPDDERAHRELDAKRLLGPRGPLARALGRPVPLARVANATRAGELHSDVHELFERLRREVGGDGPAAS